jgi:excisionase family DNA binding protein
MEKLWTTAEVAKFLGITELDVDQLVREGHLTGYKLGGQFLRFRPEQVEGIKATTRFRPTPARAARARPASFSQRLQEFIYFYDFYLVSAGLLTVLMVYLMLSG